MTKKQIQAQAYRDARRAGLSTSQSRGIVRKVGGYLKLFTWLPPHQWQEFIVTVIAYRLAEKTK